MNILNTDIFFNISCFRDIVRCKLWYAIMIRIICKTYLLYNMTGYRKPKQKNSTLDRVLSFFSPARYHFVLSTTEPQASVLANLIPEECVLQPPTEIKPVKIKTNQYICKQKRIFSFIYSRREIPPFWFCSFVSPLQFLCMPYAIWISGLPCVYQLRSVRALYSEAVFM